MLEAMISLLGRLVFPEQKIREVVTKRKKSPGQYVKAYNLCDGKTGVTEIARQIGVAQPTLSPILSDWKDWGIMYEVENAGRRFYKRLYKLEEDTSKSDTPQENSGIQSQQNSSVETQGTAPVDEHQS